MKVFCFSFIVYVVLLMTQPCQDMTAVIGDHEDTSSEIARVANTSDPDCSSDECSPFCICSCCSHPVSNRWLSFAITVKIKNSAITSKLSDYNSPATATFQVSIWQPPKA